MWGTVKIGNRVFPMVFEKITDKNFIRIVDTTAFNGGEILSFNVVLNGDKYTLEFIKPILTFHISGEIFKVRFKVSEEELEFARKHKMLHIKILEEELSNLIPEFKDIRGYPYNIFIRSIRRKIDVSSIGLRNMVNIWWGVNSDISENTLKESRNFLRVIVIILL